MYVCMVHYPLCCWVHMDTCTYILYICMYVVDPAVAALLKTIPSGCCLLCMCHITACLHFTWSSFPPLPSRLVPLPSNLLYLLSPYSYSFCSCLPHLLHACSSWWSLHRSWSSEDCGGKEVVWRICKCTLWPLLSPGVCAHVCVHVRVCVCMCVLCVCVCVCVCLCVCMCACMRACVYELSKFEVDYSSFMLAAAHILAMSALPLPLPWKNVQTWHCIQMPCNQCSSANVKYIQL